MKIFKFLPLLLLIGCGQDCTPRKTCVKSHVENKVRTVQVCVKSHNITYKEKYKSWSYHYGYSWMKGKFCWHWGNVDKERDVQKTICDQYESKEEEYQETVCDEYKSIMPEGCK